jgi:hypothetical protein
VSNGIWGDSFVCDVGLLYGDNGCRDKKDVGKGLAGYGVRLVSDDS